MKGYHRLVLLTVLAALLGFTLSPFANNAAALWGPLIAGFMLSLVACSYLGIVTIPTALFAGYWLRFYAACIPRGLCNREPRETTITDFLIVLLFIYGYTMLSSAAGALLAKLVVSTVRFLRGR